MDALNQIADNGPSTTTKTIITSVFHYSTLPIIVLTRTIISILLTIFSPLIHLGSFFWRVTTAPFSILWKLETLYIYFGIAAFIGLLTGIILYFFSEMLVALLSLDQPEPPRRNGRKLGRCNDEEKSKSVGERGMDELPWYDGSFGREMDPFKRREVGGLTGLSSQVILEEDSDGSHF